MNKAKLILSLSYSAIYLGYGIYKVVKAKKRDKFVNADEIIYDGELVWEKA